MSNISVVQSTDNSDSALIDELVKILGQSQVLTSLEERTFFSTDIAEEGAVAAAVAVPSNREELADAIKLCARLSYHAVPRGGGFSYTGGYRPISNACVIFDLRQMNRIIEINETDNYVTVECGCTWRVLYEALKAKKLRTPYFGPMSGYWATVGGALSQGSFFFGSTQYGTLAESVLSLEVVLGDGKVLRTGSAGGKEAGSPFFRWYGPDLTGLFLGDTGALGFKTQATLKLMPWPEHQRYVSFAFDSLSPAIDLVSEIGRRGLAAECYCWDPTFVKSVGQRSGILQDLKYLQGVVGSGSSLLSGIKDAARIALVGKSIFNGTTHLVHIVIDDLTNGGAEERLTLVREAAARFHGGEVAPSIPRANRGTPFIDFNTAAGKSADGIRSLPINALFPHSRVQKAAEAARALFAQHAYLMEDHGITFGIIVFAVGSTAMCVEPLLFWNDQRHVLHDRIVEKSNLVALAKIPGPIPAAKVVGDLRRELIAVFTDLQAAHVQIGKSYPWARTRTSEVLDLIHAIKRHVDPAGILNPGSLGLNGPT